MIKNYFKTAWRNLFENIIPSFINISSPVEGMAVTVLIGMWIYDKVSFNTYHHNYNRIIKIMCHQGMHGENHTNDVLDYCISTKKNDDVWKTFYKIPEDF